MPPVAGLILNLLILAALGVTIFYCLRLSRQFEQMRADRKVFEALIQGLNAASTRAEASIKSFKEVAVGNSDILQEKINKSRVLADELEIMIQAGDSLADRLQGLAEKSRKASAEAALPEASETQARQPAAMEPRTRAEKELLEALRAKQKS